MYLVQLESLPGFGHKRVKNILAAVEASRSTPVSTLLLALGISGIGTVTADLLLQNLGPSILVCSAMSLCQPRSVLIVPNGTMKSPQHRTVLAVQDIAKSSKTDLLDLPGISDITAGRITAWFGTPDNFSLAVELANLWVAQPSPVRQNDAQQQQGVTLAGIALAPGDEIVATGAIGVSRPKIKRWCGADGALARRFTSLRCHAHASNSPCAA